MHISEIILSLTKAKTMSKFIFNASINSTNIHMGDNYFYKTPGEFYNSTPDIEYSDTDRQLVELIYENTESDAERLQILDSLKSIKESGDTDIETKKNYFEPISVFLTTVATTLSSKILAELAFRYLQS